MRAPRWKCGDKSCPKHDWQDVDEVGEYDPVDVALGALEAHWQRDHPEKTEKRAA